MGGCYGGCGGGVRCCAADVGGGDFDFDVDVDVILMTLERMMRFLSSIGHFDVMLFLDENEKENSDLRS